MWYNLAIGLDKSGYQVNSFLISQRKHVLWVLIRSASLDENICCGYSLEVPQQGASNEYPQHMFSSAEALLMSTHNLCFHREVRKI